MSKKKDTKEFIKFKTNFSSKVKSRNQLFVSTKSQKSKSIICIYQKSKVETNYLYLLIYICKLHWNRYRWIQSSRWNSSKSFKEKKFKENIVQNPDHA